MTESNKNIDELVENIRYNSSLPIFVSIFVGTVLLALGVNLFSGAIYDILMTSNSSNNSVANKLTLNAWLAGISFLAMFMLSGYLFWLSSQQAPTVRRVITLILPFDKLNGKIRLREIPKLRAHVGVADMVLNWAISKGGKSTNPLEWHNNWIWPPNGSQSPVSGDGVTILYDLVEWMVIHEIANYGEHIYAGRGDLRPGDDFDKMPTVIKWIERDTIYRGTRKNYLWEHSNKPSEQKLKLPERTEDISLRSLAREHGVEKFGVEPVRELTIRNPAGSIMIRPSQIWRRTSSRQVDSLLRKHFGNSTSLYPLELKLQVVVHLNQWAFIWPWSHPHIKAYQRWLLELQEQMVRHMDIERYIEADYQRMLVEIRDGMRSIQERGV